MDDREAAVVNILWTGGWESTCRITFLLRETDHIIQPYYLIDLMRKSYPVEIETMYRIKKALSVKFDISRIRPINFYCVNDIAENPVITRNFNEVGTPIKLGIQYDWVARFLDQHEIHNMELSIEKGRIYNHIHESLELVSNTQGSYHVLKKEYFNTELSLFKDIHFPLITYTPVTLLEKVKKLDLMDIMLLTWFCDRPLYHPVKKHIPCYWCKSCREVRIKKNMGWRIPWYSLIYGLPSAILHNVNRLKITQIMKSLLKRLLFRT
jgi:7-cyano-7-deazaguanine synthase in queuosine biosynthesis